jgi:hypothetical protein
VFITGLAERGKDGRERILADPEASILAETPVFSVGVFKE